MARISQRKIDRAAALVKDNAQRSHRPVCPLCERPIPAQAKSSRHHLIPRLKGGTHRGTVLLHQICHSAIHARYSEAEIAQRLGDIASLRQDGELAQFISWVRRKPDDFHAPTRKSRARTMP